MRKHRRAHGARIVAFVVGRERADDLRVGLEVGVALTIGRRRAQQARVDREGLCGVDRRSRAIVDLRFLPAEEVAERLQRLREELGVDGIIAELNPGGLIPPELETRSLELLAREVAPALR